MRRPAASARSAARAAEPTDVVRSGPLRYARARRFEPPVVVAGVEPTDGSICPQAPSRLERVMGPPSDAHAQSEDCLALSVTAPDRPGPHPVLVFLHGGGFTSGSGLFAWYDGARLTSEQDIVVVSVGYRVGPLGWLTLDGVSPGNLGLLDCLAALEWVREEIGAFGGDAAQVTLCGQSAGAASIAYLLELPQARPLFRRAIMQSCPDLAAWPGNRPDHAADQGARFATLLDGRDPDTCATDELLAAFGALAREHQQHAKDPVDPPFLPVRGQHPLPAEPPGDTVAHDVLLGWNSDELTAFGLAGAGERGEQLFASWIDPGARWPGARVTRYRLDWRPAGSPFGATHCLDLPLLFGDADAWRDCPMLGTTPWAEVDAFGARLRATWAGFVQTGRVDLASTAGDPISWS